MHSFNHYTKVRKSRQKKAPICHYAKVTKSVKDFKQEWHSFIHSLFFKDYGQVLELGCAGFGLPSSNTKHCGKRLQMSIVLGVPRRG